MAQRPEWAHFLSRQFTDFYLEDYARAAEITGGRIDLYLVISDLGTQRGPPISSAMFREFVAPYWREMTDLIHSLGGRPGEHGNANEKARDCAGHGVPFQCNTNQDPVHGSHSTALQTNRQVCVSASAVRWTGLCAAAILAASR